jgi:hypothetical protein
VLFIQGAELGGQILALGITEPVVAHGRQAKIDAIHAQGGLAMIAHPEEVTDWSFRGIDGIEIFNIHAALKRKQKEKEFLAAAFKALKQDPDHAFLLLCELDLDAMKRRDEWGIAGIAGNDAHQNVNLFGLQVDPYERSFRFVSTHVLAGELTERAILEALKARRCYVAFDLLGDPRGRNEEWREFRGKKYPWIVR